MVEDQFCGLRGPEFGVVDIKPVPMRDIEFSKFLRPAGDVRRVDLLHHPPTLRRILSLPEFSPRTFEPDRNK